jgi:hypothetical protein
MWPVTTSAHHGEAPLPVCQTGVPAIQVCTTRVPSWKGSPSQTTKSAVSPGSEPAGAGRLERGGGSHGGRADSLGGCDRLFRLEGAVLAVTAGDLPLHGGAQIVQGVNLTAGVVGAERQRGPASSSNRPPNTVRYRSAPADRSMAPKRGRKPGW